MTLLDACVHSIICSALAARGAVGRRAGDEMKSRSKVWLGVGAFVVVGSGAAGVLAADASATGARDPGFTTDTAIARVSHVMVAQHEDAPLAGGEGGETKAIANLP